MAENQPPAQPDGEPPTPPTGLPALPAGAPPSRQPPGLDAEEYRRFQEFQRFQDYQHFVRTQQGRTDQPLPAPPHQELVTHLADMRQQLARIERVTNPPAWRKVLRSRIFVRLVTLGVVLIAVYIAYQHFFGADQTTNPAALHPGPVVGSGRLYDHPKSAVAEFYHVIADGPPGNTKACEVLTNAAKTTFAQYFGVTDCAAAIAKVFGELTPDGRAAYSNLIQIPDSALVQTGDTAQISSCGIQVDPGLRLGLFLLTRDQAGEWQVTGHRSEPNPCPAPPTTSGSAPPTS